MPTTSCTTPGRSSHGEGLWERFNTDGQGQRWYLRALTDAFAKASDSPMVADLELTVAELERLMDR